MLSLYLLSVLITFTFSSSAKYEALTDFNRNWEDANTECQRLFGTGLATLYTEQDAMEALQVRGNSEYPKGIFWVGMSDQESEGIWLQRDGTDCEDVVGTKCDKLNIWRANEPKGQWRLEDCAAIGRIASSSDYDNMLNDMRCHIDEFEGYETYALCDAEETTTTTAPAQENCVCPLIYAPVCCGGQTFGNECMACNCDDSITEGECKEEETTTTTTAPAAPNCVCPRIYAPVCCNSETFVNECEAQCNGCTDTEAGECKTTTTTPPRVASCACPLIWAPVCCSATDVEYPNQCQAECNGCTDTTNGECQLDELWFSTSKGPAARSEGLAIDIPKYPAYPAGNDIDIVRDVNVISLSWNQLVLIGLVLLNVMVITALCYTCYNKSAAPQTKGVIRYQRVRNNKGDDDCTEDEDHQLVV